MVAEKAKVKKPIWESKVFWFNIVMLAMGIVEMLKDLKYVNISHLLFVGGILNLILRIWFTNSKIEQ